MPDPDALRLARSALAFQQKLAHLPVDVDAIRRRSPGSPWGWIAELGDSRARGRIVERLFPQLVAPWPALPRLSERTARLALLDRSTLLRQWCAFALAARPGVLRCCIDGAARRSLRRTLGPAFDALACVSHGGRVVSPRAALWSPLHWACVGHLDWIRLLKRDDLSLARMARLSLPPGLLAVDQHLDEAPPAATPVAALAFMDELGLEWSC